MTSGGRGMTDTPTERAQPTPFVAAMHYVEELEARLQQAEEALNCEHNHEALDSLRSSELWEYVEHQGKTWNRCVSCGLLELWEGGQFIRLALSQQPVQEQQ